MTGYGGCSPGAGLAHNKRGCIRRSRWDDCRSACRLPVAWSRNGQSLAGLEWSKPFSEISTLTSWKSADMSKVTALP